MRCDDRSNQSAAELGGQPGEGRHRVARRRRGCGLGRSTPARGGRPTDPRADRRRTVSGIERPEPPDLPVAKAAWALRAGTLTARRLVQSTLDRIARRHPALGAFVAVDAPGALAAAERADAELAGGLDRGPLHGIPVGVKEVIAVEGWPTGCGSFAADAEPAARDAGAIARLRGAGAIPIGRLATYEHALGGPSFDGPVPPPRNPWGAERITGGSSSGSAAAVAGGLLRIAVGTDTGGVRPQPRGLLRRRRAEARARGRADGRRPPPVPDARPCGRHRRDRGRGGVDLPHHGRPPGRAAVAGGGTDARLHARLGGGPGGVAGPPRPAGRRRCNPVAAGPADRGGRPASLRTLRGGGVGDPPGRGVGGSSRGPWPAAAPITAGGRSATF